MGQNSVWKWHEKGGDRFGHPLDSFYCGSRELVAVSQLVVRAEHINDLVLVHLLHLVTSGTAVLTRIELTESMTNFFFARHPAIGGEELYLELKKRGILIRHFNTERIKDYNRITIGTPEQMDRLIEAISGIMAVKG